MDINALLSLLQSGQVAPSTPDPQVPGGMPGVGGNPPSLASQGPQGVAGAIPNMQNGAWHPPSSSLPQANNQLNADGSMTVTQPQGAQGAQAQQPWWHQLLQGILQGGMKGGGAGQGSMASGPQPGGGNILQQILQGALHGTGGQGQGGQNGTQQPWWMQSRT